MVVAEWELSGRIKRYQKVKTTRLGDGSNMDLDGKKYLRMTLACLFGLTSDWARPRTEVRTDGRESEGSIMSFIF